MFHLFKYLAFSASLFPPLKMLFTMEIRERSLVNGVFLKEECVYGYSFIIKPTEKCLLLWLN
jgi:hypothetical protein